MQTIKIDINNVTAEQIGLIADFLKRGLVLAYPTDTVYGLGCDAGNASAVDKINKIKGSPYAKASGDKQKNIKPMLVLISDFKMLKKYCSVNLEQTEYLKKVWGEYHITPLTPLVRGAEQRPVTAILENRKNLPDELTGGQDSLAVRLPKSEFLIKIIDKCGFPIVSTSLNITGQLPLNNVENLERYFDELPDLVVDAGVIAGGKPSRLIDLRDAKNIKVIRK